MFEHADDNKPEERCAPLAGVRISRLINRVGDNLSADNEISFSVLVEFLRLRSETSSEPNDVVFIRKRRENATGRSLSCPLAQSGAYNQSCTANSRAILHGKQHGKEPKPN